MNSDWGVRFVSDVSPMAVETLPQFLPCFEVTMLFSPSSENNVNLCVPGCSAAVDLGCAHFPPHTTSETITQISSFLGQFLLDSDKRPLDRKLSASGFYTKTRSV